jgi:hypothetical protein
MLLGFYVGWFAPSYGGGVWYSLCGNHAYEQSWLNQAIAHVKLLRAHCDDPDLTRILDYTLARYHRVGAWDVMFAPCIGGLHPGYKTIGVNCPHCPGLTLDTELLSWDADDGALILIHEAMHDFYPYYGHGHITWREEKLGNLSYVVRRIR